MVVGISEVGIAIDVGVKVCTALKSLKTFVTTEKWAGHLTSFCRAELAASKAHLEDGLRLLDNTADCDEAGREFYQARSKSMSAFSQVSEPTDKIVVAGLVISATWCWLTKASDHAGLENNRIKAKQLVDAMLVRLYTDHAIQGLIQIELGTRWIDWRARRAPKLTNHTWQRWNVLNALLDVVVPIYMFFAGEELTLHAKPKVLAGDGQYFAWEIGRIRVRRKLDSPSGLCLTGPYDVQRGPVQHVPPLS